MCIIFCVAFYPPLSEHCVMKGIIHGEADEKTSEERKNVVENPAGSEIHMSKLWNNKKKTHKYLFKKMKIYIIKMAFNFQKKEKTS